MPGRRIFGLGTPFVYEGRARIPATSRAVRGRRIFGRAAPLHGIETNKEQNNMTMEQFDILAENHLEEYFNTVHTDERPEDIYYCMEDMDNAFGHPWDAVRAAMYGGRYGHENDMFDVAMSYFVFNACGNIESLDKEELADYMKSKIDEDEFVKWCIENYPEDFDSIEE